jgi:hypothetical protein
LLASWSEDVGWLAFFLTIVASYGRERIFLASSQAVTLVDFTNYFTTQLFE